MHYGTLVPIVVFFALSCSAAAQQSKPIIGINTDVSGSTESARLSLGSSYVDAVTSAGGIPILLPQVYDDEARRLQVQMCDGFVFTGGRDIDPAKYGEDPHPSLNPLHPRREENDFELVKEVLRQKKPFLAVCLGSQTVNVALGGSLMQDIPTQTSTTIAHRQSNARHLPVHEISITTNSRVADLVGTTTLAVNSFHHQSCARPGKGITFTAHAPDGVVEAYELENYPFGIGVQWHPEGMTSETAHLAMYKGLVEAAAQQMRP